MQRNRGGLSAAKCLPFLRFSHKSTFIRRKDVGGKRGRQDSSFPATQQKTRSNSANANVNTACSVALTLCCCKQAVEVIWGLIDDDDDDNKKGSFHSKAR